MIVVELGSGPDFVTLRRASRGTKIPEVRRAVALTAEHWQALHDAWRRTHG